MQDYAIFLDLPLTFDSKVRLPRAPSRGARRKTRLPDLLLPPSAVAARMLQLPSLQTSTLLMLLRAHDVTCGTWGSAMSVAPPRMSSAQSCTPACRRQRMLAGGYAYEFEKDRPARFGVMPRGTADGRDVRWFELPPLYIFHVANAWQDGNTVVLFACVYQSVRGPCRCHALPLPVCTSSLCV